jgi:transposase
MEVRKMSKNRQYNEEFKVQAVKLAKEIGGKKAAEELNVPYNTLTGWIHKEKIGEIDIGVRTPENAMSLAEEVQMLRKKVKEQEKEIRRINEMNEFLEDAAAFFAASRQKSGKTKD